MLVMPVIRWLVACVGLMRLRGTEIVGFCCQRAILVVYASA